jgi:hypothetical protein
MVFHKPFSSDGRLIRHIACFLRLFDPNSLTVHHPFGGSSGFLCTSVTTTASSLGSLVPSNSLIGCEAIQMHHYVADMG